jgi:hypothetical protein
VTYQLKALPVDRYTIITKRSLMAAKVAEGSVVKLYYAGEPMFLCNLGDCGTDVLNYAAQSWKDTQSLSRFRGYIKRNACLDTSSNIQSLPQVN